MVVVGFTVKWIRGGLLSLNGRSNRWLPVKWSVVDALAHSVGCLPSWPGSSWFLLVLTGSAPVTVGCPPVVAGLPSLLVLTGS